MKSGRGRCQSVNVDDSSPVWSGYASEFLRDGSTEHGIIEEDRARHGLFSMDICTCTGTISCYLHGHYFVPIVRVGIVVFLLLWWAGDGIFLFIRDQFGAELLVCGDRYYRPEFPLPRLVGANVCACVCVGCVARLG